MGFICTFEKGKLVNTEVWVSLFRAVGADISVRPGVTSSYPYNLDLTAAAATPDE